MKKRLIWIAAPIVLLILWFGTGSTDNAQAYEQQIAEKILQQKTFLKSSAESPFQQYDEPYKDPEYYPIDPKYRVNARVERIAGKSIVAIPDNDGGTQPYTRFAWLHFTLDNSDHKLLVLKPVGFGDANYVFCAFADETSAIETYGAGRYLDVKVGKSDKTVLDFNLAYNPYCAYVDGYTCPLPPSENLLNIAIRAGEKNFK